MVKIERERFMIDTDYILLKELKKYAKIEKIPIMQDASLNYLVKFIEKNSINTILEIGSAIGYSSIVMALSNPNVKITTIERDETRYLEAVKNIKKFNLEKRITIIYKDALDLKLNEKYDLIFIDAAKGQNQKFFEKYKINLNKGGFIITDNINFHGFVNHPEQIKSKNLRQLVRKIQEYITFLEENEEFDTEFLNIGDGISISHRKSD